MRTWKTLNLSAVVDSNTNAKRLETVENVENGLKTVDNVEKGLQMVENSLKRSKRFNNCKEEKKVQKKDKKIVIEFLSSNFP